MDDVTLRRAISFDPPENLQIRSIRAKSLIVASPALSIYTCPVMEWVHIYNCRCELISFLLIQVLQNLLAKDVRRLTLFVYIECLNK